MVAAGAMAADPADPETPLRSLDRALRQWSENQHDRHLEPAGV